MYIDLPQQINNRLAVRLGIFLNKVNSTSSLSDQIREEIKDKSGSEQTLGYTTALSVLADLSDQGWNIEITERDEEDLNKRLAINVSPKGLTLEGETVQEAKERIRAGHLIGVEKQFRKKSIQDFIHNMHDKTRSKEPIDLLIDNSSDLIKACLTNFSDKNDDPLVSVIDPYIQEASSNIRDEFTNIKLSDIWRYFRLTWSLEYKTNPGRSLGFLIRNRARPNHPIIGITMMASPVMGLGPRDERLCLTKESFIDFAIREKVTLKSIINWIDQGIKDSRNTVDCSDLPKINWRKPDEKVIEELSLIAQNARRERVTLLEQSIKDENFKSIDKKTFNKQDYLLFKTKRAEKLRKLVNRKILLDELKSDAKKFKLQLSDIDKNNKFLSLIGSFVLDKKISVIDSDVMDLSVCGAVYPYNSLISGKLAALLMASNEAQQIFKEKYKKSDRQILTKMAGRKVRKASNLRCITTTSIFGVGSSQYNRLKIDIPSGNSKKRVQWEQLGDSVGYGTYHFSDETQQRLDNYLKFSGKTSSVNYEFGEGTSPKMRKLRESLSNLGFKSDKFLLHQNKRITYLCELYPSTQHEIYGLKKTKPKNITQKQIAKAWRKRWLNKRIFNEDIKKTMMNADPKSHTLKQKIEQLRND